MTFGKTGYLTIDEAARYLKDKRGEDVRWTHVFRLALDGHLPLVVEIPVSTPVYGPPNKDWIGLTIEGVWDLVMEGEQGKQARRWIERLSIVAWPIFLQFLDPPQTQEGRGWSETETDTNSIHIATCPRRLLVTSSRSVNTRKQIPLSRMGASWGREQRL